MITDGVGFVMKDWKLIIMVTMYTTGWDQVPGLIQTNVGNQTTIMLKNLSSKHVIVILVGKGVG
tara:strand:- start:285 stop:476 length:192 start_codon:yes stop_codon:yes gene_type:complete